MSFGLLTKSRDFAIEIFNQLKIDYRSIAQFSYILNYSPLTKNAQDRLTGSVYFLLVLNINIWTSLFVQTARVDTLA